MIKDNIKRAKIYYGLSENLRIGFEWLKNTDLASKPDGKYVISDSVYANIQTYETKNTAPYEAHKKYIDIQYMIDGQEMFGVKDYSDCKIKEQYNPETDCEFLEANSQDELSKLNTGEFVVFFPHDAHKPALKFQNQRRVKKVIVKAAV